MSVTKVDGKTKVSMSVMEFSSLIVSVFALAMAFGIVPYRLDVESKVNIDQEARLRILEDNVSSIKAQLGTLVSGQREMREEVRSWHTK